jgi:SAC3 family protein LENG8/THP3
LIFNIDFKGTCYTLEKSYFRLTSDPDPSEVRPEEVLHKALELIIKKWKNKEVDYLYLDDQFRSMRQDVVVQRIQNAFTVKVSSILKINKNNRCMRHTPGFRWNMRI